MLSTILYTALAITPATAHVVARGCGGHDIHVARDVIDYHNAQMSKRQSAAAPTDVASLKALGNDETAQCTPYSIPAVSSVQASYPTLWETAKIPAADTEARALFEQIEATLKEKLPNATPKPATGAPGSGYDPSDPDCWWTWQGCTNPDPALGIPNDLYELPTPNTLALTIDDGPNCSQNAFYEFLREQNQKMSVYFIGSNVLIWPLQAQMAHDDGHEICVHTWSHQLMTSLSNEEVFAELYYTRNIIKDVVGVTPRCWRPAQGDVDNRVRVIAAGLNLTNILWTDDTDPNSGVTPADIDTNYQNIINSVQNGTWSTRGSVMLAHQSANFSMSKLVEWIPRIKSAFTHVVPFASAYNWTTPYVESDVVFPSFEQYINNETASAPADGGSGPTGTLSGGPANPSNTASGGSGSGGSGSGSSSSAGGSPSGTTGSGGASTSTGAAARGTEVGMGMVGVVLGGVLAWASI